MKQAMVRLLVLVLILDVFMSGTAFGWGGPSHSNLAGRELGDPTVAALASQYLSSSQISTITGFIGEPPETYHHPAPYGSWPGLFSGRHYLSDPLWLNLDEATRLKYLVHMANDTAVPLGHSPARTVYIDSAVEVKLEAQVATWASSSYPNMAGQSYSGTYAQTMVTHQNLVVANASAFKSLYQSIDWWRWQYLKDTRKHYAAIALPYAEKFTKAFLVDYFLAKKATVANANGGYAVNPGGSVALSAAGSYDPDSVTWRTNSTYYNNGGGIGSYAWDMNGDGTYETAGASPNLTHAQLLSLVGPTEGKTITLRVADNDPGASQKSGYDTATIAVYTNPTCDAKGVYSVNPGGSVTLSGTGSDADGGSITAWNWDLNNSGSANKVGQSVSVAYSELIGLGLAPSETGHSILLGVMDNESAIGFDTATIRIYAAPTCDAHGSYAINPGGNVTLTATGSDPDGGSITQWNWDVNGGGTDTTTQNPTFSYSTLVNTLGLAPSETGHTVTMAVVDNEGATGSDTAVIRIYADPTADGYAQYAWIRDLEGSSDFDYLKSGAIDPDGGTVTTYWDLNNNGTWDFTGDGVRVVGNDFFNDGAVANEHHVFRMKVVDNEGRVIEEQNIQMALLVNPTCNAGGDYTVNPGGSITLTGSGSDADGGSIIAWAWNLNGSTNQTAQNVNLSYDYLVNTLGLAPSEIGHTISLNVTDNDGEHGFAGHGSDIAIIRIYTAPTCDAQGEYSINPGGTVTLNATGSDADGGSIMAWNWNLNGGGIDRTGQSVSLSYSDIVSTFGLTPDENGHTINLGVLDNESATGSSITKLYVYANPTCSAGSSAYSINPGGNVTFSGTGSDPDGGSIVKWYWNVNGGATDKTGQSVNFSYNELLALGLTPSETGHWVTMTAEDNESATGTAQRLLRIYANPLVSSSNYSIVPGENLILNGVGSDPDGGLVSFAWDLDGDGVYDDLLTADGELSYLDLYNMGLDWLSIHTIGLKVTDNEGVSVSISALLSLAAPIAGDFNLDGRVSGYDFLTWNAQYGMENADWTDGDANGDGVVNGQDFLIWNAHYGDLSSGPQRVPEPASLMLLAIGGMAVLHRRRRLK